MILIFLINGEDVPVETDELEFLYKARNKALADSHNTGRPAEEWEIRNEKGELLDPNTRVSFGNDLKNGSKLFLTLEVGFGGSTENDSNRK